MRTVLPIVLTAAVLAGLWGYQGLSAQAQVDQALTTENGDVNGDGRRDIGDSIYMLNWIFSGGPAPVPCEPSVSEAPLLDAATGAEVGSTVLVRTTKGLSLKLRSAGLPPGHAITAWWCFFNKSEACAGGPGTCGDDLADWENVETGVDCLYATGFIAGAEGEEVTASAFLEIGEEDRSVNPAFGLPVQGLQDPMGAEVQIWIRDHGLVDPERIERQIQTYEGDCGDCADTHFSVHLP